MRDLESRKVVQPDPTAPDEGMIRDMFAQYGLAAYWGQVLENTFVQMQGFMARLDNHAVTPVDLSTLELKTQKKTLGTLLREFRKLIKAIEPIEDLLDAALDRRNFLTHHFFRERDEEIKSVEGIVRVVKELQEIGEQLAKANQIMTVVAKLMLKCIRQDAERGKVP